MAFRLYSTNDGHVPAWEYYECSAMQPKVGLCMALNADGQLEASATPAFICMREEGAAVEAGTKIPVVRIAPDQIWESVLATNSPNVKVGNTADVSTTCEWVKATGATNNNLEITYLDGLVMDSVVRVRFK